MLLLTITKPRTWRDIGTETYVRRNGTLLGRLGRIRNWRTMKVFIPDTDFVLDVDDRQYIVRILHDKEVHIELRPDRTRLFAKYEPYLDGCLLPRFEDPMGDVNPYDDESVARLPLYLQHFAMCCRLRGADTLDEAVLENGTLPLLRAVEAIGCVEMAALLRKVHEVIPEADAAVDETDEDVTTRVEEFCKVDEEAWMDALDTMSDLMYHYLIMNDK